MFDILSGLLYLSPVLGLVAYALYRSRGVPPSGRDNNKDWINWLGGNGGLPGA